ncbi:hypothetical protein LSTR_LSTR010319 [Laodelphax striatellus]|uniref:Homeobox domain-containing protein n=1 Tax=Laodelphax striatellus TaxID=195883 RepID=A0A482X0A3_LAOST|nr:hypothetical protein LSTR_LSTR010319 [Laodelphax striatellus]
MTAQKPSFAVEEEILHRTRAGRALRNRKYRRLVEDQRQNKRLFTPEIKRFLKSWLVRRRKNPYPNRSEKKDLALKTGLTYVQVCNWFANWRRKLKKSSRERNRCTWGNLIKDYNTKAQGNVEQFSISSDDSIWDETAVNTNDLSDVDQLTDHNPDSSSNTDHCYFSVHNCSRQEAHQKCPTQTTCNELDNNGNRLNRRCNLTSFCNEGSDDYNRKSSAISNVCKRDNRKFTKYHNREGEKDDRKCTSLYNGGGNKEEEEEVKKMKKKSPDPPLLLSKWLESAAKFVPRDSFIAWTTSGKCRGGGGGASWPGAAKRTRVKEQRRHLPGDGRHREELDAAEALTSLSRQSWITTAP